MRKEGLAVVALGQRARRRRRSPIGARADARREGLASLLSCLLGCPLSYCDGLRPVPPTPCHVDVGTDEGKTGKQRPTKEMRRKFAADKRNKQENASRERKEEGKRRPAQEINEKTKTDKGNKTEN